MVKCVLVVGFVVAFEGVCVETQWFFWVKVGFSRLLLFSDLSILAFLCVCAYGYEGRKV